MDADLQKKKKKILLAIKKNEEIGIITHTHHQSSGVQVFQDGY